MAACPNCGRALPEGAIFCPDCGARAADYSSMPSNLSPSHFNTAFTATSQAQASPPVAPEGPGFVPPSVSPSKERRSFGGRSGILLLVVAILGVLLVGTAFELGAFGPGGGAAGPAANSPSNPFTGQQLYAAFASNQTSASSPYANKTVYVQDTLDSGVSLDISTGRFYSSMDSGAVVLYWSSQAQLNQIYPGATVLARCSVQGVQASSGATDVLYLQNCDLLSVQSQASTVSVSMNNE